MAIKLSVIDGPIEGQEFILDEHDIFTFGRSENNRCYLEGDNYISRYHFLIEANPPECNIKDLGSLNGTYINDEKIGGRRKGESQEEAAKHNREVPLNDGDIIEVGHTTIEVLIDKPVIKPSRNIIFQKKENEMPDFPEYDIIKELGRGGMGIVYFAKQKNDGKEVALKIMLSKKINPSEKDIKQFLREMMTCHSLNHKNIITFYNQGYHNGMFYFAMEYCNGKSVYDLLCERGGKISVYEAMPIMIQVLEGLDFAHKNSIVHRDIKPENILLQKYDDEIIAKISDFGLAKNFQRAGLSGMTMSGSFAGTYYYMPKEQIIDFRMAKPVTDVFSVGATFYKMLSGYFVYEFEDFEPLRMILEGKIFPLKNRNLNINPKIIKIIDKAISPDSDDRYQSAGEMLAEMKKINI